MLTMLITFSENKFTIGGFLWIAFMAIHMYSRENIQKFSPVICVIIDGMQLFFLYVKCVCFSYTNIYSFSSTDL